MPPKTAAARKKLCFVIMGFGKKTDFSNPEQPPRTLDLNATYKGIIRPAVRSAGYECIRADEISHSGVIDKVMYEMLLRADLVVADISTANPNALYELGVRHALCPRTTMVIKEIDGKFIFDLNHLATLQYKHLGEDIGAQEAKKQRLALRKLIADVEKQGTNDSPVYTFLQGLQRPVLSETQFKEAVDAAVASTETLSHEVELAGAASLRDDLAAARDHFRRALELQRRPQQKGEKPLDPDPYLVQQLALYTYKSKKPNATKALTEAWKILSVLHPATSTDPETLGIGGAIQRRLWDATGRATHLELAIDLYGRGFEVRRDYYTGENFALCLDDRASHEKDLTEAGYARMTARKVRERIAALLEPLLRDKGTKARADYMWMVATMANVGFALGRTDAASRERDFLAIAKSQAPWVKETYLAAKEKAARLRPTLETGRSALAGGRAAGPRVAKPKRPTAPKASARRRR